MSVTLRFHPQGRNVANEGKSWKVGGQAATMTPTIDKAWDAHTADTPYQYEPSAVANQKKEAP